MKNIFYIISFFTLLSCNKNKLIDNTSNNRSDSLKIYYKLISNNQTELSKRFKFSQNALKFLKKSNNSAQKRELLLEILSFQVLNQKFYRFDGVYASLLKNSEEAKDSLNIANAYRYKAGYHRYNTTYDSAFYFYLKSEKIYQKLNDKVNLGNVLLNKSITQYYANDFLRADVTARKAYSLLKNTDDKNKVYVTLTVMGNIANELRDYKRGLEYHSEALRVVEENKIDNDQHPKATSLNNIGHTYKLQNKYKEAIPFFNRALSNKKLITDTPDLYILLLDNLAYCKLKVNDFRDLPNMFLESLKLSDSLKLYSSSIYSLNHLSEYYALKNDFENARKSSIKAIALSKTTNLPVDVLTSLKQSTSVFPPQEANKYSLDYIRINDSLQQIERKSQEKFARIQLETKEIQEENEGLATQNRNLLIIFIIVFIIVALLFVVRAQRARTRELLYKQAQQKANEDIYNLMMSQQAIIDESRSKEKKRLAQDLHDGVLGRMFGLRLNLDSLNHNNDDESIRRRFDLLNELKTIEQDIREISHDLNREKQVLINNFVSIVHNLLEDQKSLHEVNLLYSIDNNVNWDKVANAIKINMYRILQEGLQNINKYANAKNINVEIKGDKENVYLKIQDDGIGFDVSRKSKGIGMQNMISRTQECQGIIDISSKKNEGTKITITLPIETKQITVEQE